jgi:hypothetical protein
MKSLIWKEWRENVRWCLLPVLLILGPMILTGIPVLLDEVYCFAVSLVAGIFGAMLGFLQFFPEARGDRRSLMLHLPLSRSRIFLAKVIAGMSLYALALGVPFICVVALAAAPGYVAAPFRWPMALPWLADVLTGLVYYFAGILVAQREASWYGSRLLPLAAGLFASIVVWTASEFRHALAALVLAGGLAAVAAWASLMDGGARTPIMRFARLSWAVTLLSALGVLIFVGKATIGLWLEKPFVYPYEFDRQGRVLIVLTEDEKADRRIRTITDLAGNVPEEFQGQRMDSYAINEIMAPGGIACPFPKLQSYRNPGRFLLQYKNGSTPGHEAWWYVPQVGRIAGYDKQSKRLLGSFGPDGFVPPGGRPTAWFNGDPSSVAFFYTASARNPLAFPDGVYTIDFHSGVVRTLFIPSAGEQVEWASRRQDEKEKWALFFVGTDRAVYAFELDGSQAFSAPLACPPSDYRVWSMGRLENPRRYWVWYAARWHLPLETMENMPELQVAIYDAGGQEIWPRQTAMARPGVARDTPIGSVVVESSLFHAFSGLVTPPAEAAVFAGAMRRLESQSREQGGAQIALPLQFLYFTTQSFLPGVRWDARRHLGLVVGFFGLMLLSSVACGLACFLLPRCYAVSRRSCIGWALTGFVFGWAGMVLMLVMNEWPARVVCARCRKLRVVTRVMCEHCGARQAMPAPDGTEVFEEEAEAPQPVMANG